MPHWVVQGFASWTQIPCELHGARPTKVAAVCAWLTSTNVSDLKSWLGLASYYQCYIPQFADIANSLHWLTDKDAPFEWDATCI